MRHMLLRAGLFALALLSASLARAGTVPVQSYRIVHSYPHDNQAYTQGLAIRDGVFFESTGLYGRSSVRKVRPESGYVFMRADLSPQLFGEGLALTGDRVIVITWINQVGLVLRQSDLSLIASFSYSGEGWGLTSSGQDLWMSDGSAQIRRLDPETFAERDRINVTADGKPVTRLNELEWVRGELFANVWHTDRIARIDPKTGQVRAWIDLSGLYKPPVGSDPEAVLNGIAYDAAADRLYVTGKLWPSIYEISIVDPSGRPAGAKPRDQH